MIKAFNRLSCNNSNHGAQNIRVGTSPSASNPRKQSFLVSYRWVRRCQNARIADSFWHNKTFTFQLDIYVYVLQNIYTM